MHSGFQKYDPMWISYNIIDIILQRANWREYFWSMNKSIMLISELLFCVKPTSFISKSSKFHFSNVRTSKNHPKSERIPSFLSRTSNACPKTAQPSVTFAFQWANARKQTVPSSTHIFGAIKQHLSPATEMCRSTVLSCVVEAGEATGARQNLSSSISRSSIFVRHSQAHKPSNRHYAIMHTRAARTSRLIPRSYLCHSTVQNMCVKYTHTHTNACQHRETRPNTKHLVECKLARCHRCRCRPPVGGVKVVTDERTNTQTHTRTWTDAWTGWEMNTTSASQLLLICESYIERHVCTYFASQEIRKQR